MKTLIASPMAPKEEADFTTTPAGLANLHRSVIVTAGHSSGTHPFRRALGAILHWRVPPNWSWQDWREEMEALAAAAARQAECDFDSSRRVPLNAFVYGRVVARAFTRYRQEWAYAKHCTTRSADDELSIRPVASVDVNASDRSEPCESLDDALTQLSESSRWLLKQIFWNDRTEREIAARLRISHQAVGKRKRVVLQRLRAMMG